MNTPLLPVQIYPSQLAAFKAKAELLAISIAQVLSIKKLSAFKRNDYLAVSLGYKGHPDLIEAVKFRADSDKEQQLLIFSNADIRSSIAEVFSAKLTEASYDQILTLCHKLGNAELGRLVIDDLRKTLGDTSKASAEAIRANTWTTMLLDETWNTPDSIRQHQDMTRFYRELEAKHTIKNSGVKIVINISEIPRITLEQLHKHPTFKLFLKEVRQEKVTVCIIGQPQDLDDKKDWRIKASIDAWGVKDINKNLLELWKNFNTWLMTFFVTERIHVTERIYDHRWITPIIQYGFDIRDPAIHQFSKLTNDDDIKLFIAFMKESKQAMHSYGHIFDNSFPDIDLKDIIDANDVTYINLDAVDQMNKSEEANLLLPIMIRDIASDQRQQIEEAKSTLAEKSSQNPNTSVQALCDHNIYDSFGDNTHTTQQNRCLICSHTWETDTSTKSIDQAS